MDKKTLIKTYSEVPQIEVLNPNACGQET